MYDYPNNLSSKLKTYVTHDSATNDMRYNLLYSVYSYPNIILPLIGGILVDKVGIKLLIILLLGLQLIGQGVFTIAGFIGTDDQSNSWPFIFAIIGRFLIGMGGESLSVCQYTILSRWFIEKELALSNGLGTSIMCIVGVIATYTLPSIAETKSLGFALLVGFKLSVLSFFAGIGTISMEKYAEKENKARGVIENHDDNEKFD